MSRLYNVNLLLHWNTASQLSKSISVPFPCKRVVIKPIIYDYADAGAAPNPYEHVRITCDLLSDNNGDATIGIILPVVWSTGAGPLAGFTYTFDNHKIINGIYTFKSVTLDGTAAALASDAFVCMEFYDS